MNYVRKLTDENAIPEIDINNYINQGFIGEGGYGKVYIIQNKQTKILYSAKILNKLDPLEDEDRYLLSLKREVGILRSTTHPCVVRFHGFCSHDFNNQRYPIIITEYAANGSLRAMLDKSRENKVPSFDDTIKYINMYGIAKGMSFLHKKNVIHRDLKTSNVLLNHCLSPLICDFGLAKLIDPENSDNQSTINGTFIYQAPEIIRNKNNKYDQKVDVYAYGFILYEIITGLTPYDGKNRFVLMMKMVREYIRPSIPEDVPDEMKKLIEDCWDENPQLRPTFDQIIERLQSDSLIKVMKVDKNKFDTYDEMLSQSPNDFEENIMKIFTPYSVIVKKRIQLLPDLNSLDYISVLDPYCQELIKKAKNGDIKSMYIVGKHFLDGERGFPKNHDTGIQFLQMGQKCGSIESTLLLAEIYYNEKEYESSIYLLKIPGIIIKPKGKLLMAKNLLEQPNKSYTQIKNYLHDASTSSNKEAMVLLGKLYMQENEEETLKRDLKKAFHYFELAAKEGDAEGLAYYGLFYYYGYGVVSFDFKIASESFYESYEKGSQTGAAFYAECLARGRGVEKNEKEAVKIAKHSAEEGNNKGKNIYGLFLNQGVGGLEIDKKKSCCLWKESAEEGDAYGEFLYGNCLIEGSKYGVKEDIKEAISMYKKSILGGCQTAMATLGQMLMQEQFFDLYFKEDLPLFDYEEDLNESDEEQMSINIEVGLDMIKLAADGGDDFAIVIYSHILANGIGMKADMEKALHYLEIGLSRNLSDCHRLYGELVKKGTFIKRSKSLGDTSINIANKLEGKKPDQDGKNTNNNGSGIFYRLFFKK